MHLPALENLITLHCQLSFQESQQIIMQSVHAVQVTWHSGSLPVRREIIRTLWGCEHLKWIQILCSSNATIWGSSGNMQIFLKLQSWLWGWIIIFDSSFLSDITLGKAQCSSAWHAAFQTKASAFCDIICFQENCCLQSVHLSSPHPISSPHYSQIPLKCVMLLIFSPKALVQQLKKKKKKSHTCDTIYEFSVE